MKKPTIVPWQKSRLLAESNLGPGSTICTLNGQKKRQKKNRSVGVSRICTYTIRVSIVHEILKQNKKVI